VIFLRKIARSFTQFDRAKSQRTLRVSRKRVIAHCERNKKKR